MVLVAQSDTLGCALCSVSGQAVHNSRASAGTHQRRHATRPTKSIIVGDNTGARIRGFCGGK